jgi:hypothetical protein
MDASVLWLPSAFGVLSVGDQRLSFEASDTWRRVERQTLVTASVGSATDATVQRLSPPFMLCGEANS